MACRQRQRQSTVFESDAHASHYSFDWLQLYKWGYQYVENLTWIFMDANNTILTLPSDYAQKSHLTLFIFRKEGTLLAPAAKTASAPICLTVAVF